MITDNLLGRNVQAGESHQDSWTQAITRSLPVLGIFINLGESCFGSVPYTSEARVRRIKYLGISLLTTSALMTSLVASKVIYRDNIGEGFILAGALATGAIGSFCCAWSKVGEEAPQNEQTLTVESV